MSYEFARVAEIDGCVAGVLVAFPARARYRLHARLLLRSVHGLPRRRVVGLLVALPALVALTPRPPRDALYIGTIAVARRFRRQGVAFALGGDIERLARAMGFTYVVAHTGTRHWVARRALEVYGLRLQRARRHGYALYVLDLRG